jgi:hypothetical protein
LILEGLKERKAVHTKSSKVYAAHAGVQACGPQPAVWDIWIDERTFRDAWTRFGSELVLRVSAHRYADRP